MASEQKAAGVGHGAASSPDALSERSIVGVVGAGAMGAGIAQVAATAGHRVLLLDARAGAAAGAIEAMRRGLAKFVAKGRMSDAEADAVAARVQAADAVEALAPCALVVEAIVEEMAAKRSLLAAIEAHVADDAMLATNTSSLSISALAAEMRHPERFAGMHFFNPATVLPLVEIVSGERTACDVAVRLHATAAAWGKTPVHARSSPGFIVNRVARPFYAEALLLLAEEAATPATIDAILRDCGGFRMGPFEVMDLIGHDVNYAVTQSVFEAFAHDPRYATSTLQKSLVEAGQLGRKTGRGFYAYGEHMATTAADVVDAGAGSAAETTLSLRAQVYRDASGLGAALAQRLGVEPEAEAADGRVAVLAGATIYVTDGRTATERAAATGETHTVLVDLALDYAKTPRLALAKAQQASACALHDATRLLAAAGFVCSPLKDVAGMAVLRTVAMLADEAASALEDGVASARDIDLAMLKGVNYPLGPLAWADALGPQRVVAALDYMRAATGKARYRVSAVLRQKAQDRTAFLTDDSAVSATREDFREVKE